MALASDLVSYINAESKTVYRAARNHVFEKTGMYANACATTASLYLIGVDALDTIYMYTSSLSDALEANGWQRINDVTAVRPGDVIFMKDYNHNGAPDHVVIALSQPDADNRVSCVDNQYGGQSHVRALRMGGVTPMWYALRAPVEHKPLPPEIRAEIMAALKVIYQHKDALPHDALALLNQFRWHGFLG